MRVLSKEQRGYGAKHQNLRQSWQHRFDHGAVVACARCGRPIFKGMAWDLGHDDHDRSRYTGPEHVKCNRGASRRAKLYSRRW